MTIEAAEPDRTPTHPIDPLFHRRWSPRSFSGEHIPDAVLASAFEAARWAPSASNLQPWRFVVARQGAREWPTFLSLLIERNQRWAAQASALILVTAQREIDRNGERRPLRTHSFDAGAAWANFAHQTLLLGWHTRAIGGFDRDAARIALSVPDDFAVEAMVAIGRRTGVATLDADFHDQEKPNGRREIADSVFVGRFGQTGFANHADQGAAA